MASESSPAAASPSPTPSSRKHDAHANGNGDGTNGEAGTSSGSVARRTAVAASIASVLTKSALHPLDTLKCRLQIYSSSDAARERRALRQQKQQLRHPAATTSPLQRAVRATGNAADRSRVAWREVQQQYAGRWGLRYLYGGLPVKLVFYVPYQAVYQATYNTTRNALVRRQQPQPQADASAWGQLPCTIAAAMAAEVASCTVRVPMETLKMRIQSSAASGTGDAFRQLWHNGLRACARLAVPQTLMHDIPYSVVQWVSYEALRPRWELTSGSDGEADAGFLTKYRNNVLRTFLSGGFSGLLAAAVTLPLDNIRTRMVVATAVQPGLRVRDVVRATYRLDGPMGFLRGGSVRVLWVSANMALYFPLFELSRSALRVYDF